ncbi:TetR/AcrR family transcriptional regulator [Arthrobacter sp. I2-34]|uniref:TetR/AcrR family transcriptional regulator n=1 Tax=Arthrobacter hankyongi TaxID=2904801 RepID=A0ABS9L7Z3_9MICC|nr:TetR/AcrR family transcriptional regulator [Arthrobacter hankyongi]MCG2622794.1 TetR/AcrR family transcriptional regulator [Arthrobacter hankyongi]
MSDARPARSTRLPRIERRRQLLQAAHEVFAANGYHGAAMDEIADAAHVSKPVLYQHFPGKRELYLALLDLHLQSLTGMLSDALGSTTDNKERVRAAIGAYFRFTSEKGQPHRIVFESDLANDPDVAARLEGFNARLAGSIAEVLAEETNLSSAEATLLGRALAGMAQVSARYWLESDAGLDRDGASELIYRLAWRGISRFPKEP